MENLLPLGVLILKHIMVNIKGNANTIDPETILIKVNGYIFQGNNFAIFSLATVPNWHHLLKSRYHFGWRMSSREENRNLQKLFAFVKNWENVEVYPHT